MSEINLYIKQFKEIKKIGWIESYRSGDTGIGYTLEKLINQTKEQKKRLRIKSIRKGSSRRLTLFAKTPIWGEGGRKKLLDDHGYFDKNSRWSLYTSITSKKQTRLGWQIELDSNKVFLNNNNKAIIYWDLLTLQKILKKKFCEMVLVYADFKKNSEGIEFFNYKEFYLAKEPDLEFFTKFIEDGSVCIDLAIHRETSTNKIIDKGFLFRISESKISKLFNSIKKIT